MDTAGIDINCVQNLFPDAKTLPLPEPFKSHKILRALNLAYLIGNGEKLGAHGPRPIWWMMTILRGHVFLSFFMSSSILK